MTKPNNDTVIILRTRWGKLRGYTLVDKEDYDKFNVHKWFINQGGYVMRVKNHKNIHLCREILNVPKGKQTDHINRDKLDNRKENLRICNHKQNQWNSIAQMGRRYKGTNYRKDIGWRARIRVSGKLIEKLGYKTEKEAALAYNVLAKKYHGEFARLNII